MNILSIDTSSDICGVSILDNKKLICNMDSNLGRTHSENLMPNIKEALNISNLTLNDIDLIACDIGPGSFTGIRIGIATVKAFNDVLNIPCVGITSLEALAYNVKDFDGIICPIIDCKNSNCYYAIYKFNDTSCVELAPPKADSIENLCNYLNISNFGEQNLLFVGDGSINYKDVLHSKFPNSVFAEKELNLLNSYNLGLAGLNKFAITGNTECLLPLYLKKPQAQKILMDINICEMSLSDLKLIKDCLLSDFDNFWNYNILESELESQDSNFFVAKIDNEIVGFAGIKIIVDEADIMNIVVKKAFRNMGIGKLLLKKLIETANKLNLTSIILEVNKENSIAIKLYESFGFKEVGIRKNYYGNTDGIIMKKQIK